MNRNHLNKILFAISVLCLFSSQSFASESCEPAFQICAVSTPIGGGLGCINFCREPREPKEPKEKSEPKEPREQWEPRPPPIGRVYERFTSPPIQFKYKGQSR